MIAGSLLLVAAGLAFGCGVTLRVFIGRRADSDSMRRRMHAFRQSKPARVFFGRVHDDEELDPDELDQLVLMPAIVLSCGLCLTAFFLLGYRLLS